MDARPPGAKVTRYRQLKSSQRGWYGHLVAFPPEGRQAVLLGDQAGKAGWAKYRTQEAGEVFLIDRIEGETIYGRLV